MPFTDTKYLYRWLSAIDVRMRILSERTRFRMPLRELVGNISATPAETALALKIVSKSDLLRLKTIARIHARGLPADAGWADLLQEAFARVLDGSRQQPEGVPLVAFLAGVMRSLKSEHWRRALRESQYAQKFGIAQTVREPDDLELGDPTPDPERLLSALQEVAAIDRLFASDRVVLQIINGLAEGLTAEQIRTAMGISKTDYDSARKRMRRTLLREGLTCRLE
jgi:DNA-directed RNA polymerase specialized sigma24 family protein